MDLLESSIKRTREKFPNVRQLSTDDCYKMLEYANPPVLLDCRTDEEYKVSKIPGAIQCHGSLTDDKIEEILSKYLGQDVVCYCASGYRSSQMVERIQKIKPLGIREIWNLEGSIFKWVNEGKTVVDGKGVTKKKVHAFGPKQVKLIKDPDFVFLPKSNEDDVKI